MVNIFGKEAIQGKEGARGPVGIDGSAGPIGQTGSSGAKGERGDAGVSGIVDLFNWLPYTILSNFQKDSEEGCFHITKRSKDLKMKGEKVVKWISRSLASTLDSQLRTVKFGVIRGEPCKKIKYFEDGRGYLSLKRSLFEVNNVSLTNTYSFICTTFKIVGDALDQYIVSNWETDAQGRVFRGVSASKGEIRIHGCVNGDKDYVSIKRNTEIWTTLFVEWTEVDGNHGRYDINNGELKGGFTSKLASVVLPPSVYIGGRSDNTHFFNGEISAVEWCSLLESRNAPFPDTMKTLIIENQYIDEAKTAQIKENQYINDVEEEEEEEEDKMQAPPSCKIMKFMLLPTPVLDKQ